MGLLCEMEAADARVRMNLFLDNWYNTRRRAQSTNLILLD